MNSSALSHNQDHLSNTAGISVGGAMGTAGGKPQVFVYCRSCALRISSNLLHFVILQEYKIEDLTLILNHFKLVTIPFFKYTILLSNKVWSNYCKRVCVCVIQNFCLTVFLYNIINNRPRGAVFLRLEEEYRWSVFLRLKESVWLLGFSWYERARKPEV